MNMPLELSRTSEAVPMDGSPSGIRLAGVLPETTQLLLERMFRDPQILSKEERSNLVDELQFSVQAAPEIVELRVLLGMAEAVDFRVQSAMENLREAVGMEPDNFLAQLKLGELLMRLRVCDQAVRHTEQAAQLAANPIQSELARRQAATLRTMLREGIERDGVTHPLGMVKKWFRQLGGIKQSADVALIGPG
jgi:tetratricopeptide (TPR) repeat protein